MTSPKDALEKIAKFYPEHPAWCNAKIDTSGECDCFLDSVRAAIPVAELHEEMEDILKDYGKRGVNMPIGVILELRDRREALKCKSPK